jgi:hypothetical protein
LRSRWKDSVQECLLVYCAFRGEGRSTDAFGVEAQGVTLRETLGLGEGIFYGF